jgi:hypothetical protein
VARPCCTRYHVGCIRIGLPFVTRLSQEQGVFYPKDFAGQQQFICKACTVRLVRLRELGFTALGTVGLMLERARLVDTANKWSSSTLKAYQSKYNPIADFERDPQVRVLPMTRPAYPPSNGPAIRLMWAQERYSLYPSDWRKKQGLHEEAVKFGTLRAMRSAASHFWILDLLNTQTDQLTFGFKDRPVIVEACSPTDQASYTYFTEGLRRRLGDHPQPSTVLTGKIMKWIDDWFFQRLVNARNIIDARRIGRAAITHLASYLGWLRALKTFGLKWGHQMALLWGSLWESGFCCSNSSYRQSPAKPAPRML